MSNSGSTNMDRFNLVLTQFRMDLGLRDGTSIIWSESIGLISVGYLNIIQEPPVNDNEAKP